MLIPKTKLWWSVHCYARALNYAWQFLYLGCGGRGGWQPLYLGGVIGVSDNLCVLGAVVGSWWQSLHIEYGDRVGDNLCTTSVVIRVGDKFSTMSVLIGVGWKSLYYGCVGRPTDRKKHKHTNIYVYIHTRHLVALRLLALDREQG